MTLLEIKTEAANRLNLSSTEALARLASYANQRYRRLTSSLGLTTSRRATASISTSNGVETVTFALEKIDIVYYTSSGNKKIIYELPYEEFRRQNTVSPQSGTPRQYAIKKMNPTSVQVSLYPTPNAVITLMADGLATASTLADGDTPNFPADFHDALIIGAMSDELFKMEKYDLAKDFQNQYEARVSDLRMFLAKSAFISYTEVDNPGGLLEVPRKRWQS